MATFFSHHRPCVSCQFSWKNWRPFLIITIRVSAVRSPEKTGDLFWSSLSLLFISLVHLGVAHYFRHAKNLPLLLWGALFMGPLFGRTCWPCLNTPLSSARTRERINFLHRGSNSMFNHVYLINAKSYRIRRNNTNYTAIPPFKVIQCHRFWYQSKASMLLPISD